jgi:hypothetical protein
VVLRDLRVFKVAAGRLNETRNAKEKLQRIVAESEGAERQLRDLTGRRAQKQEALAVETALVANLEQLASEAACRSVAAEQVRLAQEELLRIQKIGTEVETAERAVAELAGKITEAEQALNVARGLQAEADAALAGAEEAARVEGSDPGVTDTMRPRRSSWRSVRKGRSRRSMRRGSCYSTK